MCASDVFIFLNFAHQPYLSSLLPIPLIPAQQEKLITKFAPVPTSVNPVSKPNCLFSLLRTRKSPNFILLLLLPSFTAKTKDDIL
jgi:hypothetical protein